jgi:hypothetical protein
MGEALDFHVAAIEEMCRIAAERPSFRYQKATEDRRRSWSQW